MKTLSAAMEELGRGRWQEAERACLELVAAGADSLNALAALADIQLAHRGSAAAVPTLRSLAELRPGDAATRRRLGNALLACGRYAEAARTLRAALDLEPDNVRAHNNLGQALRLSGALEEAIGHLRRAVELDATYAIGHCNLGLALTAAGRAPEAVPVLRRALATDPGMATAHRALAAALEESGDPDGACALYDAFLERHPTDFEAWAARGTLLLGQGRAAAALESFDHALRRRPDDADVATRKAQALLALECAAEALACADTALRARADLPAALNVKAAALARLQRPVEALACFDRALALEPRFVEAWCNLGALRQNLGDTAGALRAYRDALDVDAACLAARAGLLAALIPPVPASGAAAAHARAEFAAELLRFEDWLRDRPLGAPDTWTLARQPLFYLSYQEADNKALLMRYRAASAARVARQTSNGAAPEFQRPSLPPPVDTAPRRLRLGIVSAHVYDHPVYTAIVQGWLQRLGPSAVEMSVFSLGVKRDAVTAAAAAAAAHYDDSGHGLDGWSRLIRERRLDALIFPEVGMDRDTLALAHQRLAPLQLAAWGHPETTGLPTIDAFLSADALEPPDAADHYSERLIRLPRLGVCYEALPVTPHPVDWAGYGISRDAEETLFVCAGTPFKYAPADDWVLVNIARALGRCRFLFFTHERAQLSRLLGERLHAAFADAGLDAGRHIAWLPWLPRARFFGVLRGADAYLDTLGFSGFNTLMQAVQANLPCVALEGRFLRGRLGSGILRTLGLPECVAATRAEYVAAAVRLGQDSDWRAAIRQRMAAAEASLYADQRPIDALLEILGTRAF